MKGLGKARRIDEAFQVLESVERGTAVGRPKLSAPLIYGLLNALVEAGLFHKFKETKDSVILILNHGMNKLMFLFVFICI